MEFDFTVEYWVRLEQQKRRVIPQTEYCLPFEVARLGEKQVLSLFVVTNFHGSAAREGF